MKRRTPFFRIILGLTLALLFGAIVNVCLVCAWTAIYGAARIVNQTTVAVPRWGLDFIFESSEFVFDAQSTSRGVLYVRRGWPMASMGCEARCSWEGATPADLVSGGILLEESHNFPNFRTAFGYAIRMPKVLPLVPLWWGFLMNTLYYATIPATLWLLLNVRAVQRWRRIKRGLCPKCAYDLRGSKDATTCPECGATHTVKPGNP